MSETVALTRMLATVAAIYVGATIAYGLNYRFGMAIVFFGYAVANIGLIMDLKP